MRFIRKTRIERLAPYYGGGLRIVLSRAVVHLGGFETIGAYVVLSWGRPRRVYPS